MGISEERGGSGRRPLESLEITDITSPIGRAVLQETRLRMIALLASAESKRRDGLTLQELGQILECSPQNAHHHLKILERVNAVYVVRKEATQRIPRQFWVSDLRLIRLRPTDGSVLELDMGLPDDVLRRLSTDLKPWADAHGGEEAHRIATQLAAFVRSLDDEAAGELMDLLKKGREP